MKKHTPGPWKIDWTDKHGGKESRIYSASNRSDLCEPIAIIPHDDIVENGVPEIKANAALITAAPDLLKALQGVLRIADRKTDEFDAARDAIAKATGATLLRGTGQ